MKYTDQDILEFIQSVKWLYDGVAMDTVGVRLELCIVQIFGKTRKIYKRDLNRIIKRGAPGYHPGLSSFLHTTPLENVPLFIHDIPEFARWRLRIAK